MKNRYYIFILGRLIAQIVEIESISKKSWLKIPKELKKN